MSERMPVTEYRELLASLLADLPRRLGDRAETLDLTDEAAQAAARGRVLAEDVRSVTATPPFDASQMDGFAVRASDAASAREDAPAWLPVGHSILAGDAPDALAPGQARPIMTGAVVPAGADAVVPVEETTLGSFGGGIPDRVGVLRGPEPGRFVRRSGSDLGRGEVVLTAGTVLGPSQLGALVATGAVSVRCLARPRVAILTTGTELTRPGRPLRPGSIYDANGTMLSVLGTELGAVTRLFRIPSDDPEPFAEAWLEVEGYRPDLIVSAGGISEGTAEAIRLHLGGQRMRFLTVAMQPGGPQGYGTVSLGGSDGDEVPLVALPGNPVSVLVSWEVLLKPALRRALAGGWGMRRFVARLEAAVSGSPAHKLQFLRGVLIEPGDADGAPTVRRLGGASSHLLTTYARANCLIEVPVGVTDLDAGTEVVVWPLAVH